MEKKIKITVDILMCIIFILLMCHQFTGLFFHEILGVSVILLFILHQILNINYYKNLFKGKYTKLRVVFLIINSLLLILMILMIISAILISQHIFQFINFRETYFGREIHILTTYSLYMLCGLHLGLHYNTIVKLKNKKKLILNIFLILFALTFGVKGFIENQFIEKLSLQSMFPIYFEGNILIFILYYKGIFIMFTMLGYGIFNLIKPKKNNSIQKNDQ